MQTATRKQLKQDKFVKSTQEAVHWTVEHRSTLVAAGSVLLVALVALWGGNWYFDQQDQKASLSLSAAMETYDAQLRAPDAPLVPGETSFTSTTERAKAAHDAFAKVAAEFPRTKSGRFAMYMAGVAAADMGDNSTAEKNLKDAAENGGTEISALAKFALAGVYRQMQKDTDAAKLYREVAAANTPAVPALNAKLALADMLEAKQPAEAIKTYEEVLKDAQAASSKPESKDKKGPSPSAAAPGQGAAEQIATARLAELKNTAK